MIKNGTPFLYIVSLIACCIEVDISVPSFPGLVVYFNTSESLAQHTVSMNFLGFFISALIIGPLADSYGRRSVMIVGNAILMIGALACVWAPSIELLLLARFVQGLGAATSAVVVFAMISDTYTGKKATTLIGFMNCVLTCLMAASPVAGSFLNESFGWQGSYLCVAIVSVVSWVLLVLGLPETLETRSKLDFKKLLQTALVQLNNKTFLKTSIAPSLLYAAYLSFITLASFLYMHTFKLSMMLYAVHQAFIVSVFALVSLCSGTILKYVTAKKCVHIGISLSILGAIGFLISSILCPNAVFTTATVSIFAGGTALFYPVVFAKSLEIFPSTKGIATSLIMAKRAILVAASTCLSGCIYNGSPESLAMIMVPIVLAAGTISSSKNRKT